MYTESVIYNKSWRRFQKISLTASAGQSCLQMTMNKPPKMKTLQLISLFFVFFKWEKYKKQSITNKRNKQPLWPRKLITKEIGPLNNRRWEWAYKRKGKPTMTSTKILSSLSVRIMVIGWLHTSALYTQKKRDLNKVKSIKTYI